MAVHPDEFKKILRKQLVLEKLEQVAPSLFAGGAAGTAAGAAVSSALTSSTINNIDQQVTDLLSTVSVELPAVATEVQDYTNNAMNYMSSHSPEVFLRSHNDSMEAIKIAKDVSSNILKTLGGGFHEATAMAGAVLSTPGVSAVAAAASSAGSAVTDFLSGLDPGDVAQATSVALNALGSAVAVFPFLAPVQIALKDLGLAVQGAVFNRESARLLTQRCADCSAMTAELAPKIDKISEDPAEKTRLMKPLVDVINECGEYLKTFTKRGFLMHIVLQRQNQRDLMILDKKVTDTLQNLGLLINGKQMDIQAANSEKLNEVISLVNKSIGGTADVHSISPEVLADIASKCGCATAEAMSAELKDFGFKLEEIEGVVKHTLSLLTAVDAKVDKVVDLVGASIEAQERRAEELKDITVNMSNNLVQKAAMTLNIVKELAKKQGATVQPVYSTRLQSDILSVRANELRAASGLKVIVIHPHGIDVSRRRKLNGSVGHKGADGAMGRHGRPGASAVPPSLDGQDGDEGDDGDDGEDGEDGQDGDAADDFEVTIELQSRDDQYLRTYHIEHSGRFGKEEDTVTVDVRNTVILLDGKGGDGGRGGAGGLGGSGGKGGNGGDGASGKRPNEDGGDGGLGGNGGRGGLGGVGGKGGSGANGAKIVLHTSCSEVLALLEVDVSGGVSGESGVPGEPGAGGGAGAGGHGGHGSTWLVKTSPNTEVQYSAKAGKEGKSGKDGKPGKKSKPSRDRDIRSGEAGSVCFNVYADDGLNESGGIPYRVVMNKQDLKSGLSPESILGRGKKGVRGEQLMFGGTLSFGPIAPINTGSLASPVSQLVALLRYPGPIPVSLSLTGSVTFPSIPAAKQTRNGELGPGSAQTLLVNIPNLKQCSFSVPHAQWPWAAKASPSPLLTASLQVHVVIDECAVRVTKSDGDHAVDKRYEVTISAPVELLVKSGHGSCQAQPSVEAVPGTSFPVQFAVVSKSKVGTVDLAEYRSILRVASPGFRSIVSSKLSNIEVITTHEEAVLSNIIYQVTNTAFQLTTLPAEQSLVLECAVALPASNGTPADALVPGTAIAIRSEVTCEGTLFQYSAPTYVRLAHPRPTLDASKLSCNDVLVFAYPTMAPGDYDAIRQVIQTIGMTPHFLDYYHFRDPSTDCVRPDTWSAFVGLATILWAPQNKDDEAKISGSLLQSHVVKGGGLILGDGASFTPPPECNDTTMARRIIISTSNLSLSKINADLKVVKPASPRPQTANNGSLSGLHGTVLAMNILSSFSTVQKLQYLEQHLESLGSMVLGAGTLSVYQTIVEAGCCGGKVKTVPASKTPCTVVDVLLLAVKTDLYADIAFYGATADYSKCLSIAAVLDCLHRHSRAKDVSEAAVVLHLLAVCEAVQLGSKTLYPAKSACQAWNRQHGPTVTRALADGQRALDKYRLDHRALACRLSEAVLLKNGYIRSAVFQTPIDLSNGSSMYLNV